jgi:CopG family nickel-responsive transcriptional regulator
MDKVERIGVSLEPDLLAEFDEMISEKGYHNRSEALRDLIRKELANKQLEDPSAKAVGVVLLVFDHHVTKLTEKLLHLQHSHLLHTISSLHVHLDHHHCLEIIVLQGSVNEIQAVGDRMISLKGVKQGRVNLVSGRD